MDLEKQKFRGPGLPDDMFFRGKAPMTKSEVRAVTLSKMQLHSQSRVLDVGAGSGSLTIEAALCAHKGKIWGIERKEDAFLVFMENLKRFGLDNVIPILGLAPKDLPEEKFDTIVVGGSGGQMDAIVDYGCSHLISKGRFVVNAITVETVYKTIQALKKRDFFDMDIAQIQVSKGRFVGSVTMMEALNPIYVISATRK